MMKGTGKKGTGYFSGRRARRSPPRALGKVACPLFACPLFLLCALPAFAADEDELEDATALKGEAKARLQNVEQLLNDWDIEGRCV